MKKAENGLWTEIPQKQLMSGMAELLCEAGLLTTEEKIGIKDMIEKMEAGEE